RRSASPVPLSQAPKDPEYGAVHRQILLNEAAPSPRRRFAGQGSAGRRSQVDELLTAAGRTTRPAGPAQLLGRAAIRFAMAWLTLTLIAQQARDAAEGRFQHPLEAAASEVGARIDRWRLLVSLERRRPAAGYAELKEEAARLFEAVRRKEELEA